MLELDAGCCKLGERINGIMSSSLRKPEPTEFDGQSLFQSEFFLQAHFIIESRRISVRVVLCRYLQGNVCTKQGSEHFN